MKSLGWLSFIWRILYRYRAGECCVKLKKAIGLNRISVYNFSITGFILHRLECFRSSCLPRFRSRRIKRWRSFTARSLSNLPIFDHSPLLASYWARGARVPASYFWIWKSRTFTEDAEPQWAEVIYAFCNEELCATCSISLLLSATKHNSIQVAITYCNNSPHREKKNQITECFSEESLIKLSIHSFFFIRMLFFWPRLNILIFLPILGWKYSCTILKL